MSPPSTPLIKISRWRSIRFKTALLSWIVIILALGLFTLFTLPHQQGMLIDRLGSTAEVVATSIEQVTVTSIVVEDYSTVIEHCLKVVKDRPSVGYLVITRKDGFSLVNTESGWSYENLEGLWLPDAAGDVGRFMDSDLLGHEVFHFSHPLIYSGIEWGWIHIGLTTDQFHSDLSDIYTRVMLLAFLCIFAGSLVSIFFARKQTSPLLALDRITHQIADGDLSARAEIRTGDEVESLAQSFNQMADALLRARDELEIRVEERTADLRASNQALISEMRVRKQAEQDRLEAVHELENQRLLTMRSDRLRSLGEMAAGIAHELNQPLVGVRGIAEHILIGLQRGWDLTNEKLADRLSRIVEQADRMVHIIDHVRLFAREAGKPDVSPVRVDDVVRSAVDLVGAQFRSRGVELKTDLGGELPDVMANPFSLEEVLLNLLNNARDAVDERSNTDEPGFVLIRTYTKTTDSRSEAAIEISDNGNGIPQENLAKIWDPFFTTKDPDKGTGLGLSICKGIVEDFGGNLQVTSEVGDGTEMTVLLPAQA